MTLKPLSNCILVKQDEEGLSSIIITQKNKLFSGIIAAVGPGKKSDKNVLIPCELEVGQHIMFGEYTGQKVEHNGVEYLMMRENEVIGILE